MKKFIYVFTISTLCIVMFLSIWLLVWVNIPDKSLINLKKLKRNNLTVEIFDEDNKKVEGVVIKGEKANIEELSPLTLSAFIAVEDKRFFSHNGIDYKGLLRALKNNIISRTFKEGGSTITQQLVKNTHLSSEKTISRKIKEIKLAKTIEKMFTKQDILNFYLNGIYFGNGAYGIESASKIYFGKSAKDLNLNEACALAGTIKAPSLYNPKKEKCNARKNVVLKLLKEQNFISEEEFESFKDVKISPVSSENNNFVSKIMECTFEHGNINPYEETNLKIYTYLNCNAQKILKNDLKNVNGGGIIMSEKGKVKGYFMPQGEEKRHPASIIKPLLVYAPAIEENIISLATKILDEKCDFQGWSPKNYGDCYHGYISAEEALYKSLNVPSVKILQTLGINKAKSYAQKMNIDVKENDLTLALGSSDTKISLTDLCACYTAFANEGNYLKPQFIKAIFKNGKQIYKDEEKEVKVFSKGTCELMSIALNKCTFMGTARAIGKRNYEICAKTGTSGNEKGNSDALTIAYSSKDIVGIWLGNNDGKLMDNSVTGAISARYVSGILNDLYRDNVPPPFNESGEIENVKLCKLAYENHVLKKADENQPEKFTFLSPMLKSFSKKLETTSYFIPKIDNVNVDINENKINFIVEKNKHFCYEVILLNEQGSKKILESSEENLTVKVDEDGIYNFYFIPYITLDNGEKLYGDKFSLNEIKINFINNFKNSDWWND